MKKIHFLLLFMIPLHMLAQGPTMKELSEQYTEARSFMIYHSSLNMLNIEDNEDFARVVHDIDRIKILIIDKSEYDFTAENLSEVREMLGTRAYEELMTIDSKENKIAVFIQEDDDDIEGFFLYMDEEDSFTAIDVRGSIQIRDIGLLVDKIQEIDKF